VGLLLSKTMLNAGPQPVDLLLLGALVVETVLAWRRSSASGYRLGQGWSLEH